MCAAPDVSLQHDYENLCSEQLFTLDLSLYKFNGKVLCFEIYLALICTYSMNHKLLILQILAPPKF